MQTGGATRPAGSLGLRVIRPDGEEDLGIVPSPVEVPWPLRALTLAEIAQYGFPRKGLPDEVNRWRRRNQPNLARGLRRLLIARAAKIPHFYGQLFLKVVRGDGSELELGLASLRLVTTTGVRFIADDFNAGSTDVSNMKFHGFGVGTNAEAAADTALQTEETTQYNPDNTRPTGSQASATAGANATYTTVGTYSPDSGTSPRPITEHGILSQAATGGGTLFDRSVFSVVNLVTNADSLQATYVLTLNSGG